MWSHYLLVTHLEIPGPQFPRKLGSPPMLRTVESAKERNRRVKKKSSEGKASVLPSWVGYIISLTFSSPPVKGAPTS